MKLSTVIHRTHRGTDVGKFASLVQELLSCDGDEGPSNSLHELRSYIEDLEIENDRLKEGVFSVSDSSEIEFLRSRVLALSTEVESLRLSCVGVLSPPIIFGEKRRRRGCVESVEDRRQRRRVYMRDYRSRSKD
jgi:hypothetical protein